MRLRRRLPVLGLGAAGVVLGHTLTYVLAIRDPVHRGKHLAEAGHGYWGAAVWIAVSLAVCSALAVFLRHLRRDGGALEVRGLAGPAAQLAVLQTAGFFGLELLERLAAGGSLAELVDHELLPLGLALQGVIALLGALLLRQVASAGAALARGAMPPPARAAGVPSFPEVLFLPGPRPGSLAWGVRGPPAS